MNLIGKRLLKKVAVLALMLPSFGVGDSLTGVRPDLAREQRLADETRDAIVDGEPLDLVTAQGQSFFSIYTDSTADEAKGTVIILHGRGFHPDWLSVVQPLRVNLPDAGWHTLSIQLPVLEKTAKYYDYVQIFPFASARIEAAVKEARARSDGLLVIAAHSCGAHMAQHWILSGGVSASAQFDAFVGIGMGATDYRQPMVEPFALDRMRMPVLDVFAEKDFPAVRRLAAERAKALQAVGNPKSAQVVIADAEHYFEGQGEALVAVIAEWLETLRSE